MFFIRSNFNPRKTIYRDNIIKSNIMGKTKINFGPEKEGMERTPEGKIERTNGTTRDEVRKTDK